MNKTSRGVEGMHFELFKDAVRSVVAEGGRHADQLGSAPSA